MILCLLVRGCISGLVIEHGTEDVQCFWSSFLQWLETGANDLSGFPLQLWCRIFSVDLH